jgi:hypothetical protein
MNALIKLSFLLLVLSVFSCLSTKNAWKANGNEASLNQNLAVIVNSFESNLSKVFVDGSWYEPASIKKGDGNVPIKETSKVITEMEIIIINSGDVDYEYSELKALEMVFIDEVGNMKTVKYATIGIFGTGKQQKKFFKNKKIKEELHFIHEKTEIPVALTINRSNRILFIDENNPKYNEIVSFLDKLKNVEIMLARAPSSTFDEIDIFIKQNNISIDDTNHQGLNLLYIGILSRNDTLVNGAIKNGCDLHKKVSYGYFDVVEPIHFAFMENNRNAVKALLNAGVNIKLISEGNNFVAVNAIRENKVEILKLLTEFGVDLSKVKVPMNWSPAISPLKFAKDRKMTEMVQYLESLGIKE